jgi:hypothetical protein
VGDGVRAGCFMMMFCVGGRPTSVLICAVFGMSVAVMTNAWVSARRGKDREFVIFESVR